MSFESSNFLEKQGGSSMCAVNSKGSVFGNLCMKVREGGKERDNVCVSVSIRRRERVLVYLFL